jgi:hypothetical protein
MGTLRIVLATASSEWKALMEWMDRGAEGSGSRFVTVTRQQLFVVQSAALSGPRGNAFFMFMRDLVSTTAAYIIVDRLGHQQ